MLASAKAGDADAFYRPTLLEEDELSTVSTIQHPGNQLCYSVTPEAQLCGPKGAAPRYNRPSGVIASLACRFSKMPCIGYYDDFGVVVLNPLVHSAFATFANFGGCLDIILGLYGSCLEFLVAAIFKRDLSDTLARMSLLRKRAKKFSAASDGRGSGGGQPLRLPLKR